MDCSPQRGRSQDRPRAAEVFCEQATWSTPMGSISLTKRFVPIETEEKARVRSKDNSNYGGAWPKTQIHALSPVRLESNSFARQRD